MAVRLCKYLAVCYGCVLWILTPKYFQKMSPSALKLTQNVLFQVIVTLKDVATDFIQEEWQQFKPIQSNVDRDIMLENQKNLLNVGKDDLYLYIWKVRGF